MRVAFLFPGQGAQAVGMGKALAESSDAARRVFEVFDRVTVPNLSQLCFEGPEEALKDTRITQPALLATELAAFEAFREQSGFLPVVAAGHSLGEYGALYAAGVLDLETVARLVDQRARCMAAAPAGAMSAVLGLSETGVEKIIVRVKHEGLGAITIANYNTGDQYVIAGSPEAVAHAGELLKTEGAKRVIPLAVSGAFHSELMSEPAQTFAQALEGVTFHDAAFPVLTNLDAQATTRGADFQSKLADQMNHSVRWLQSMERMVDEFEVDTVVEFGPGSVLSGMLRKVHRQIRATQVSDPQTLQASLDLLAQPVPAAS